MIWKAALGAVIVIILLAPTCAGTPPSPMNQVRVSKFLGEWRIVFGGADTSIAPSDVIVAYYVKTSEGYMLKTKTLLMLFDSNETDNIGYFTYNTMGPTRINPGDFIWLNDSYFHSNDTIWLCHHEIGWNNAIQLKDGALYMLYPSSGSDDSGDYNLYYTIIGLTTLGSIFCIAYPIVRWKTKRKEKLGGFAVWAALVYLSMFITAPFLFIPTVLFLVVSIMYGVIKLTIYEMRGLLYIGASLITISVVAYLFFGLMVI